VTEKYNKDGKRAAQIALKYENGQSFNGTAYTGILDERQLFCADYLLYGVRCGALDYRRNLVAAHKKLTPTAVAPLPIACDCDITLRFHFVTETAV